jgi:hypothetical protein
MDGDAMTKSVALGSIEHGLREAFRLIGIDSVVAAIQNGSGQQKSASLLRKYADPDDPRHHLPLRDAVAIDTACVRAGHKAPLIEAYQMLLTIDDLNVDPSPHGQDLCHLVLGIEAAAGAVASAALQALSCPDCNKSNRRQPEEMYRRLQALEEATAVLRKEVAQMGFERIC